MGDARRHGPRHRLHAASAARRPTSCASSRASTAGSTCAASCGCGSATATSCPWVRQPRRHARRRRRPGRRVARRPTWRTTAATSRRTPTSPSGPAQRRDVRADLEPVVPAPAVPGRPARPRWWRPSGSGRSWADALHLRRAVPRRRRAFAAHPEGADLRADRRDHRRGHDLAARGDRRRSATGTTATAGCATPRSPCRRWSRPATPRRRWPGGSGCCAPIAGSPERLQILYGVAGERRATGARAALAVRLRGVHAGARRQRRGRPAASSTSTAR